MHGQYIRSIDMQFISQDDTFLWLLRGDLKGKTERKIIAAQDQITNQISSSKILHTEKDSKGRLCKQFDETYRTHHITMPNSGKRTIYKET
jgi:hypothetical protein